MSTNDTTQTSRAQATAPDQYDHEISLIDSTKSAGNARAEIPDDVPTPSGSSSIKASGAPLGRRRTRATLREELARRKYSKWQQGRQDNQEDTEASSDENPNESAAPKAKRAEAKTSAPATDEEQPNEAVQTQKTHPEAIAAKKEKNRGERERGEYVVDILYENQRGLFWCGIPKYSHQSLLNFDPSAWQTASLKDSPVNITNAQVPDPSWEWAWKSWYVDMSQDVDEEGWQYSFAFTRGFAWHGTHPWFHSFCRRRRWLRKREKKHLSRRHGARDGMSQRPGLNPDYFTIHSPTRDSSTERTGNAQSYYSSGQGDGTEDEEDPDDISNIIALMSALKKAPMDRAKIAVVKRFLLQGGEDVFYLADRVCNWLISLTYPEAKHVQMQDIMASMLFQNSRRQLLAYLIHACDAESEHRSKHFGKETLQKEVQERRVKSLSNAVRAAEEQVQGLGYWSDVKNVAGSEEGNEAASQCQECSPIESVGLNGEDVTIASLPELKDAPDEADKERVGEDFSEGTTEDEKSGRVDKGKERE